MMDLPLVIRQRLEQLGVEQRDLASATQVTESYISQLLTRRKAPPAPERTDIYPKMEQFLKLPSGELTKLAELQRQEQWKRKLADPPAPLIREVRELILRKCRRENARPIRAIFEKQPFGELERLVTRKLLDVVKGVVKEELENESWLRLVARLSDRKYEEMRVTALEFLDTDVFNISVENCVAFLEPLIETWDIDLANFGIEVVLNRRIAAGEPRRFEYVEKKPEGPHQEEPGLKEFLETPVLSGDATQEEIEFLKELKFKEKRPTPLYYYRELQNLRDPLHFRAP